MGLIAYGQSLAAHDLAMLATGDDADKVGNDLAQLYQEWRIAAELRVSMLTPAQASPGFMPSNDPCPWLSRKRRHG